MCESCDRNYQVEVDRSSPDEWAQMIDLFCDANVYQTWAYGRVRWGTKNLSHLVLRRSGEVLGIAQVRIVQPTRLNFGMAYLRWGPLYERCGKPIDPAVTECMARALEAEYAVKRKLFLRVVPNAFVGSSRAAVMQSAFGRFTGEAGAEHNTYRTLLLDLAPGLDELRRSLDKKWRNQLSRAENSGLEVISGSGNDEYRVFCGIYQEMRRRKAFETTVDVEEFGRIQEDLAERHRMRILICQDRGMPVAGLVASAMGDSAVYLLGATADKGLNSKGAYLLQWTLIQWLKGQGIRWYDLGGIDPERNPGVYHFKRGLSGMDVSHMTPLVASKSVVSSIIGRAGVLVQRALSGRVHWDPRPSATKG